MKIMSRNFTRTEIVLLIFLAVILFGMLYYWFVYRTINNSINSSKAEAGSIQSELSVAQADVEKYQAMQAEVDAVKSSGNATRMESYNNSKEETAFLSDILSDALQYSISFSDVTRNGNQIRRSFSLSYLSRNYRDAETIMMRLCQGQYRCIMSDVNCNIAVDGTTSIGMTATFYETMVGGTIDSGLPVDEAETTTPAEDFGIDVK